jgi:hypothetical protein
MIGSRRSHGSCPEYHIAIVVAESHRESRGNPARGYGTSSSGYRTDHRRRTRLGHFPGLVTPESPTTCTTSSLSPRSLQEQLATLTLQAGIAEATLSWELQISISIRYGRLRGSALWPDLAARARGPLWAPMPAR